MLKIPSVKLVLVKKGKKETEGYISLRVGIPATTKYRFKSLQYKIPANLWDAENEFVKSRHPDSGEINKDIRDERDNLIEVFKAARKTGTAFTEHYIAGQLGVADENFMIFYRSYIDNLKETDKKAKGTIAIWDTEYDYLVSFAGDTLPFAAITTDFLNRYHKSLMKLAPTTRHKKLKKILQIIRLAIKMEHIKPKQIAGFEMISYEQPVTNYLTLGQTEEISKLIYGKKLDNNPQLKMVACYFLIECYAGIRFGDWGRFEVEKLINDENLKVRAGKNGEPIYLPLNVFKRLGKIINYVLKNNIKFTMNERDTNLRLKVLGEMVGLSFALSTHDGRRTCATLLGELGYDTRAIAEILGVSPATAAIYVKNTRQGLNNTFKAYGGL